MINGETKTDFYCTSKINWDQKIITACIREQLFKFDLRPQTTNSIEYQIITGLSVIKRLRLCEFALWGRYLVSVFQP